MYRNSPFSDINILISKGLIKDALINLNILLDELTNVYPKNSLLIELKKSVIIQESRLNHLLSTTINGIESIETISKENNSISKSILDISEKLHNEFKTLKNENKEKNIVGEKPKSKNIPIEIKINSDFSQFSKNDQEKLLNGLKEILGMDNEIKIIKKRKGSIILTIEIPEEKYQILVEKFNNNQLSKFNIVSIKIPYNSENKNEIIQNYHYNWKEAFQKGKNGDKSMVDEHFLNVKNEILIPFLLNKTKYAYESEEIVSLVLLKFWERFYLREEPLPSNVNGYIHTMVANAFFHFQKMKDKRNKNLISLNHVGEILDNITITDYNHKSIIASVLNESINKLDLIDKEIIRLVYYENKKPNDIINSLDLKNRNHYYKIKKRTLKKLKEIFVELSHEQNLEVFL